MCKFCGAGPEGPVRVNSPWLHFECEKMWTRRPDKWERERYGNWMPGRLCYERRSIETLRNDYIAWVRATFPDETPAEQMTHFLEECAELHAQPEKGDEYADVLMLLLCVAANNGIDLMEEFRKKLAVNKARKWERLAAGYRHKK
jgi:hypothetical protein